MFFVKADFSCKELVFGFRGNGQNGLKAAFRGVDQKLLLRAVNSEAFALSCCAVFSYRVRETVTG